MEGETILMGILTIYWKITKAEYKENPQREQQQFWKPQVEAEQQRAGSGVKRNLRFKRLAGIRKFHLRLLFN